MPEYHAIAKSTPPPLSKSAEDASVLRQDHELRASTKSGRCDSDKIESTATLTQRLEDSPARLSPRKELCLWQ